MTSITKLPTFDIRNFTERLQPSKQRNKYICPICGGDDLGIDPNPDPGKPPAYKCFSNECDERDIKEAIAPLAEALPKAGYPAGRSFNNSTRINKPRKQPEREVIPVKLPEGAMLLARLTEPATDAPQPQQRLDREHGNIRVTQYHYSETQWVERIEWDNPTQPKGHDKEFRQWHIAKAGELVPVWKDGKRIGERSAKEGKAVCTKGDVVWNAYRIDEAITAVKASKANALLMGEGESVVEVSRKIGIACITLQGSAWGKAEMALVVSRLKAENIVLVYLPDHDHPGYRKAQKVLEACTKVGVACLILDPTKMCSALPHNGDAVDMVKLMGEEAFIQRLETEIHRAIEDRLIEQNFRNAQGNQEKSRQGQTPAEIAAEIAEEYRERLAWNDQTGLWYRYEAEFPGVWSLESDIAIGAVVLAEFEHRMGLCYKANWIEQCIKILKWKLIVKKWEQPSHLIPFRNGVLNAQSGDFSSHAPGYRFTWALPREHNSLATDWGAIEDWMDEATGGSAKIKNILLCWLNACLKGRSDLQRFLHLTGAGGTGKGTFIRLAISLVGGKNNHASSLSDWCGNRFEPVNAYKKRLLTFADEDKYTGGLGNFKKVTGGDAIRGEIKKKQAFDFIFEGMVMLASNYPIFSGDTSSGIYRRLLMVPFNVIIPPHQRRNLDTDFEPELAALTNYLLSIPDEVVSQTLRQSVDQAPEVIERTWDWRMRQDSVAAWLNECVIRDPKACERVGNDKEDVETLFGSYYRYCEQTGSRAKGSREFSPALLELVNNDPALNWGIEKRRVAGGFMIHGLRLRRFGDVNQPYCLEALADVGSATNVGSNVGLDVGSKPLLQEGCVGCVGLEDFIEKNYSNVASQSTEINTENSFERDSSSYTPCTNQSPHGFDTLHADPTVQDDSPYTKAQAPKVLSAAQLERALQVPQAVDLLESFKAFYARYQKCSEAQQNQIVGAADIDLQVRFYEFLQHFEAVEPEVEPEMTQIPSQESIKPMSQAKWVYARLSQDGGETLVKVLSQKFNSLMVHVPGVGTKQIKPFDVVNVSTYTGD